VTVALDVAKLRKLVALDESDPLSRFALGSKLFETHASREALEEAADQLRFANAKSPEHLATYHVLGQVLAKLGRHDEARQVFEAGIVRAQAVGEGMGRDLAPAMRELLAGLPR
jgi:cytochrome c-type biogenesis protein CcmH/NrfG